VTNEVLSATNQGSTNVVVLLYRDWTIGSGEALFGLIQTAPSYCQIFFFGYIATVPFSAPAVAAGFILIVLLALVAGYYLIANLRHKDASGDAKLD
jgi:hypothetical protein